MPLEDEISSKRQTQTRFLLEISRLLTNEQFFFYFLEENSFSSTDSLAKVDWWFEPFSY